jgi:hypothetical protein
MRDEYFKEHARSEKPEIKASATADKPASALELCFGVDAVKAMGLSKLSHEEQGVLLRVFAAAGKRDQLAANAVKYLEAQGWERVTVSTQSVDGRTYLLLKTGLFRTYATEKPLLLSVTRSEYLAKSNLLGGLDSIIDDFGMEHSFLLARWKELH